MGFLNSRSLQTKVLALNASIVTVIAITVFWQVNGFTSRTEASSRETLEALAKSAGLAVQAQFYERYGDVQAFAMNPQVRARSKDEIVGALDAYAALYGIYDLIIVADLNGRIVGVNGKDPAGKPINSKILYGRSVADTEWFKAVANGHLTEDASRALTGTFVEDAKLDTLVSEVYGEKRFGNGFSALVKDADGRAIGVVTNRAGARWYEGELENALDASAAQGFGGASVNLVNPQGLLLASVKKEAGKTAMDRDFSELGLVNFRDRFKDLPLADIKISGSGYSHDELKKSEVAAGYSRLQGNKWIDSLGWSVVIEDNKTEVVAAANALFWKISLLLGGVFALSLFAAALFARSLSGQLREMAAGLTGNSDRVTDVSRKLAESSNQLSSSATQQAAALQETVASIDEVSAMVGKNAENAKRSQELSFASAATAGRGKDAVMAVIQSIQDITAANQQIVSQVEEGNRQISEIVKVITEIGSKTKVINDIVFQTKLLSFNASVEAARAGEHGKGFAVVAEEVGNLAQMSGNAAKEISEMLDGSIAKVEGIVAQTKGRVEALTHASREKLSVGTSTAKACGEVLAEMVESVNEVSSMVVEIATACKEQAIGVSEINKAMNMLDGVTQSNATSSQEAAASAETLNVESQRLSEIIESLRIAVEGGEAAAHPVTHEASAKVLKMPVRKPAPKVRAAGKKTADGYALPDESDSRFEDV